MTRPTLPTVNRRALLGGGLAAATAATGISTITEAGARPAQRPARRPNIVLIMADDLGFSDLGCFGSEIPTPHLDALAAGGLRFSQFYNCARCSPARAALLTGLYPHQAGMGALDNVIKPESRGTFGRLLDRSVTLAEVLGPAGYHTSTSGKWHVGLTNGTPPWSRGFERSFTPPGGTYYRDQRGDPVYDEPVFIDGRPVPLDSDEVGEGYWYGSDLLVDWGRRFIDDARRQRRPFFLHLPFIAPHFPVMAPPEDVARFKGRYLGGWEPLRHERFARQKEAGVIDPSVPMSAALPYAYDWSRLTAAQRERFDTIMAVYAAAVHRMDRAVGTLVRHLKRVGAFDDTLILFVSDNGGNAESGPDGRLEGGPAGSATSTVWAGLNWATLQNTPFSYFKHYTAEGGIASPMIAHWPRGIDASVTGTIRSEPGHLIDVMPTLAELGHAVYPGEAGGHRILPAEGRSFASAFSGRRLHREDALFWEHEGNRAVRDGHWKLVARFEQPWELYDMRTDRAETDDLADRHPEVVTRLAGRYRAWERRAYVDPWPTYESGGVFPGSLQPSP